MSDEGESQSQQPPTTQEDPVTDELDNPEPQSSGAEKHGASQEPTASQSFVGSRTESTRSFATSCTDFLLTIYKTDYYRKILKSVFVFLLALKMAQESKMMLIPLKEYQPFGKHV